MSKIRVTVWGENAHERTNDVVRQIYPTGMHHCIADALNAAGGIAAATATLDVSPIRVCRPDGWKRRMS